MGMLILLTYVAWGVAEGQMKTSVQTVDGGTVTPDISSLSPLEEAQRILNVINEIQANFSFKADVDAVKCGGGCGANCTKSRCFIQCENGRPVCFCDAYGYAFCGCYSQCPGVQTGATGQGSSTMDIESGKANAPEARITPTANGVRVESREDVAVRIWDVSGRIVYSGRVRGVKFIPLKRGVFFVRVGKEIKKVLIR